MTAFTTPQGDAGRAWLRPRIRSTPAKGPYLLLGTLCGVVLANAAAAPGAPDRRTVLLAMVVAAWVVVGARVFRDGHEPVAPPRAWWRFTGKPTAGFVIGGMLVVAGGVAATSASLTGGSQAALFASGVAAAIGAAYLHSSLRLHAGRPPRRVRLV
ncbi:hypothetical protein [Herbiconiux sp. A18JL235]|uniref:Uncharacterized protein n=1 Tax=Herbiconiux sp. A18JL235 TaxID=3152363 RepID=A0AB39BF88_9MICO